jgi:hypothetical protein
LAGAATLLAPFDGAALLAAKPDNSPARDNKADAAIFCVSCGAYYMKSTDVLLPKHQMGKRLPFFESNLLRLL